MPDKEARAFAAEQDNRFSTALSTALARQGLTLEQVVRRLEEAGKPVSQATLSYWQRGRALPTRESSLAAIAELERILRLPIGHLTSSLPSDAFSRWQPLHHLALSDRVTALLEALQVDPYGDVATDYAHDRVTVLEDHRARVETTREVVRALHDGLNRTAVVLASNGPEDELPLVEAGTGCELGRVVDLGERGLMAVELLLPHPLTAGQPHMRSFTTKWHGTDPDSGGDVQRVLKTSIPFLVFEAHFLGSVPSVAAYETTPYDYEPDIAKRHPLRQTVPRGRHAQVCLADPPPGWHCLSWDFEGVEENGGQS